MADMRSTTMLMIAIMAEAREMAAAAAMAMVRAAVLAMTAVRVMVAATAEARVTSAKIANVVMSIEDSVLGQGGGAGLRPVQGGCWPVQSHMLLVCVCIHSSCQVQSLLQMDMNGLLNFLFPGAQRREGHISLIMMIAVFISP